MKKILCAFAIAFCSSYSGQTLQSNSRESKLETVNPEIMEGSEEINEIQSTRTSNIKKRKKKQNESPELLNSSEPVSREKKIKQNP